MMKNHKNILLFFLTFLGFFFAKSQELPKERLNQFSIKTEQNYTNDTLTLRIENPVYSPLRIKLVSLYLKEKNIINDTIKIIIKEKSEVKLKFFGKNIDLSKLNLKFDIALGDENKKIKKRKLALPFPKGKKYRIMQEQQGNFSHNLSGSKYAIDFAMPVGETVVAADDGFVVGVIKDYQFGGNDIKWTPYANFITLYHPSSGLFTQYVHLKQNGSLVKVGDTVKRNQPIGLSGETGYVDGSHLHFNVLVPEKNKSLISVPFRFINVKNKRLKKNAFIEK